MDRRSKAHDLWIIQTRRWCFVKELFFNRIGEYQVAVERLGAYRSFMDTRTRRTITMIMFPIIDLKYKLEDIQDEEITRLEDAFRSPRFKIHRGMLGSLRAKLAEAHSLLAEIEDFVRLTETKKDA